MRFKLLCENFEKELKEIRQASVAIIERSTLAINLSRGLLSDFRKDIIEAPFVSNEEEIDFFLNIKQIPLVPLIYYSEIRSFEIQFPKADIDIQRKYIKKKINKINRFFLYNMDFVQYVESNFSHFDLQYYTRDFLDDYHITSSKFYFQDPEFTTPRDMLLGKVKAYQQFIIYLQNRLYQKENDSIKSQNLVTNNLHWTASKSALTELIYALYHSRAINNGNVEIKDIANVLQQVLDYKIGDYYKIYGEIKTRKKSRTKFLDELSTNLLIEMDRAEE